MKKKPTPPSTESKVINLSEVRAQRTDQERRKIERFFLKDLVQVFSVLDQELLPIELLEAGEGGFSFRVPYSPDATHLPLGHETSIRFYLSQDTFLLLGMRITSANPMADGGRKYMRYGCALNKSFTSFAAYTQLIKFIAAYTHTCRQDKEKNSAGGSSGR